MCELWATTGWCIECKERWGDLSNKKHIPSYDKIRVCVKLPRRNSFNLDEVWVEFHNTSDLNESLILYNSDGDQIDINDYMISEQKLKEQCKESVDIVSKYMEHLIDCGKSLQTDYMAIELIAEEESPKCVAVAEAYNEYKHLRNLLKTRPDIHPSSTEDKLQRAEERLRFAVQWYQNNQISKQLSKLEKTNEQILDELKITGKKNKPSLQG